MTHGFHCQGVEFFRFHRKASLAYRISRAKLLPGVPKGTFNSSVTVAAMSAKLLRVPRFTGFTCLPSTTRGTYSRVWSVVAV